VTQPGAHNEAVGRVAEVLGSYTGPGMEIEIALRKHDLPHVFPPEVEAQAAKLPATVQKKDMAGREDIRHLPLVTIDGETARDFDDAVYCEPQGRSGFRLIVAIADVSHYVTAARRARHRRLQPRQLGVFPAPRDPDAARGAVQRPVFAQSRSRPPAMACDMQISSTGSIKEYRFYPAVICRTRG
jgi:ribonuclease R